MVPGMGGHYSSNFPCRYWWIEWHDEFFIGSMLVIQWDFFKYDAVNPPVSCAKSTRPGERLHFAMERSTIFNGKIHYFYGHFPLLFVSSPEGIFHVFKAKQQWFGRRSLCLRKANSPAIQLFTPAFFISRSVRRYLTSNTGNTRIISYPIGSMYAIYGNIYHKYSPHVSIYSSTMDPMGIISPNGLKTIEIWRRHFQKWVCLKMLCTPKNPMVLLIIIPTKNCYFIGGINPIFRHTQIRL